MKYIYLGFVIMVFVACEKDIEFDLRSSPPVLVVDGQIESGAAPLIVLTKSLGYFSQIDPATLANTFVRNADVFITNGTVTHKLKEYATPLSPLYTGYFYSNDPADPSTAFVGEFGKTYSITIMAEGKEYTSTTAIPQNNITLDSMYFTKAPKNDDSLARVMQIIATDPKGLGNSWRYFTQKNSDVFLPGFNSVFNDEVADGTTVTLQLPQGIDRNNPPKADSNFYKKGDTVSIKFANTSKSTYTFWSTWEFAFQGIGNPFAAPNKVLGNISNGALGSFCGYALQVRRRVVD